MKKDDLLILGKCFQIVAQKEFQSNDWISEEQHYEWQVAINKAFQENPWFTPDNTRMSLKAWSKSLTEEKIEQWLKDFEPTQNPKTVLLTLAGNLPFVGLHDVLSTWVSGHHLLVKMSSDDQRLMMQVLSFLMERTENGQKISLQSVGNTKFDAVIATGSNNSARYFDYYFGKYPNIIRKNRKSVAIITSNTTNEELKELGKDVFTYFGLGCRNVSQIFIPQDFDLNRFFEAIFDYGEVVNHNKYGNNYDYHRALFLMNQDVFLENNFLILREKLDLNAPVAVLHYQRYEDNEMWENYIEQEKDNIQCVVGDGFIPFGKSQAPELWDYADNVNTLEFLKTI